MERNDELILEMTAYEAGCPQRIHHFLKVLSFARLIARMEGLDDDTRATLEAAAIVHDIGIRPSLEKYGSCEGEKQEAEGPPLARPMLEKLGYSAETIDRVCYLIAHHHSYANIDGLDYQILVEADFLVNVLEDGFSPEAAHSVRGKIFRTAGGKLLFDRLYA